MNAPRGHWFWRLSFWCSVVVLVTLSLLPVDRLPPQIMDLWDKAQHALGFVVLTVLGSLAYPCARWRLWGGLLLLGGAIELAQAATGWRQGDAADWCADAVGVAVVWAGVLSLRRSPRTSRPRTP